MKFIYFAIVSAIVSMAAANAAEYKHKAPVHGLLPPGNPYLSITPLNVQFPSTPVGSSSAIAVTVSNPDSFAALSNVRAVLDSSLFSFDANTCGTVANPVDLNANSSCSALIKFTPTAVGSYTGTFAVSADNSTNGTQSRLMTADATGSAVISDSGFTPVTATVLQGDSHLFNFSFYNSGNIPSTGTFAELSGSKYSVFSNTCGTSGSPVSLAAGQSCSVSITGSSINIGTFTGSLDIYSNGNATPAIVKSLSIDVQYPAVSFAFASGVDASTYFNFGNVSAGNIVTKSINITNTGNIIAHNMFVSIPSVAGLQIVSNTCGAPANGINLSPNSSCTLSLSYGGSVASSLAGKSVSINSVEQTGSIQLAGTAGGFNSQAEWSSAWATQSAVTLNKGTITQGNTASYGFYLRNTGTNGAMNVGFELSGDTSDFTITSVTSASNVSNFNNCGASVSGSSATGCITTDVANIAQDSKIHAYISVLFNPTSVGTKSITITPTSVNGTALPAPITVSAASAFNPQGAWSSAKDSTTAVTTAYSTTNIGATSQKVIYLRNIGSNGAMIPNFTLSGNTSDFTITSVKGINGNSVNATEQSCGSTVTGNFASNCTLDDVASLGNVQDIVSKHHAVITVTFNPSTTGSKSITITPASSNGSVMPSPITLTGTAVDPFLASTPVNLGLDSSLANSGSAGGSWSGTLSYGTTDALSGSYGIFSSTTNISRAYATNIGQFTGDFTMEAWIKPTAASTSFRAIYMSGALSNGNPNFGLYITGANKLAWVIGTYGSNVMGTNGNSTIPVNSWTHIAVSRQGSTLRMFVNGVLQTNTVYIQNGNPTGAGAGTVSGSGSVWVGRSYAGGEEFTGHIDMLRVTNGARYTTSFTPTNY